MLRFGYHLLFWNAYLQEEATQNPQLVRENPPLYGQIIILLNLSGKRHISTDKVIQMRSLLRVCSPLILVEGGGHQFTTFGGNFLTFGIIGDCAIGIEIHIHHDIRLVELDGLARDGVVHERECPRQY